MLTLFDLLSKKELGPLERELLRDRLAIIEGQRTRNLQLTGSGSLTLWGDLTVNGDSVLDGSLTGGGTLATGGYTLTVPGTGTALIGSGAANRLAVFSDEHTLAQSYALTTVGDLMYMGDVGSLETQEYYDTAPYVDGSFVGTKILATLVFTTPLEPGATIRFDIDVYAQCDGFPTSSVLVAIRRSSIAGTVVASTTINRDTTRPPNAEFHWTATVDDTSAVDTYYITYTEQSAGFGMWFSSSYRRITGQLWSPDPIPARLPIGSEDQFLRVASGAPAWETVSVITGVSDTASVDLTVTGSTLSAAVLAAGVDHNSLANLTVGDVHTQYALRARTITEGAGLAGNTYDLSANRTLAMGTPSTVTVSTTNSVSGTTHAHAATSSSNPGAAARLLASTANGYLTLVRLGFGRSPQSQIDAISDSGVTFNGVTHSSTAATDTNYIFTRGRGTIATPAAVQQGDSLGSLQFKAYYDGTTISGSRGKIIVNAAENWSSTNQGTNIGLQVTPTGGSTTLATLLGLYGIGLVAVGSSIPTARFHVFGVADVVQTIIQAHSTQTNNVLEIQSSAAAVQALITGTGGAVFNEAGTATGDVRIETDTEPDMVLTDASADILYLGGQTNSVQITKGGNLTLIGTATVYDDYQVNLANIKAPASDPPTWRAYKGTEVPAFGAANTNVLYFTVQLPHRWKDGGVVEPHFHAAYPNANTGNSRWRLTISWANIDGTFPTETSTSATFAAPGVADAHKLHSFGTISPTGKTGSSVLLCSLARIGGDAADTYASDIYATSADFHIEIDKMGAFAAP